MLVLKEPDYVMWMLGQEGKSRNFMEAKQEVRRLIELFDRKPLCEPCQSPTCDECAARCSVYQGSVRPMWWCENCDPYRLGASSGKLLIIQTYGDAACYVGMFCGRRKSDLRSLIKELAQAKGLPARVGEAQAAAFFHCCD